MRFNIVTNLDNRHGLQREYELLRHELERRSHRVHGVQFNKPKVEMADVNIFIETVVPVVFPYAKKQWVIPHPEWWLPDYHVCLNQIDQVLCKTRDALRLFTPLVGDRASFISFLSFDMVSPAVQKEDRFLHVVGKSAIKGTDRILEAWQQLPYPLTIVTSLRHFQPPPNVTVVDWISDDELIQLYNSHRFHLCPSQYEGFGHALHEGMSAGGIVITTDGPPMNEFRTPTQLLLPSRVNRRLCLADLLDVQAEDIVSKAHALMGMPLGVTKSMASAARTVFEIGRQEHRTLLSEFMDRVC